MNISCVTNEIETKDYSGTYLERCCKNMDLVEINSKKNLKMKKNKV